MSAESTNDLFSDLASFTSRPKTTISVESGHALGQHLAPRTAASSSLSLVTGATGGHMLVQIL